MSGVVASFTVTVDNEIERVGSGEDDIKGVVHITVTV